MNLNDIVQRQPPEPWKRWDHLPWNDPDFSGRMLGEHLNQEHDAASRRAAIIDRHVRYIHDEILGSEPGMVLDLGCGPGLYLERLSRLGHACTGIDFSPASIEYAVATADRQGLSCRYILKDLREAEFPPDQDLVMLLYGEFNAFSKRSGRQILLKAHAALQPGGRLLLEPSPEEHIRQLGNAPKQWYTSTEGLFSPRPHLVLTEAFWDEGRGITTERFYVIDAATAEVSEYSINYQAYSDGGYRDLIQECGFGELQLLPSLPGEGPRDEAGKAMMVILAKKMD